MAALHRCSWPHLLVARLNRNIRVSYWFNEASSDKEGDEQLMHALRNTRIVASVMREAAGRSWKHLADERIQGVEPTIPLGRRFWPRHCHVWTSAR